jgi:hypothetical protein
MKPEFPENPSDIKVETTAQLLSAARREFLNRKNSYAGPQMTALTRLFYEIARETHGTQFQWSEYNRGQWLYFVSLGFGNEGGACAFSMEPDGNCPTPELSKTQGFFLGTPLGYYPYALAPLGAPPEGSPSYKEALLRAVTRAGYTLSE